ncbi:MAG: PD-(D/E)XK nuclease family protein, partial [Planctomycetaceae bacterium]|nr:PD-(D/E)XK nuclease family protein [Planctomycetaceae bacterium]
ARNRVTGPVDRVCLYRKEEVQRLLPPELQQAFVDARIADVRESLCRLYVTATRAVHALHLMVPVSRKNEAKLPANPAGLVRAALTDGSIVSPDQILYETGDRDWSVNASRQRAALEKKSRKRTSRKSASVDQSSPVPPTAVDVKPMPEATPVIRLSPMPRGRRRGLTRVAPSRHEEAQPVKLRAVLQRENRTALRRGTLLHAWFEQVGWLDAGPPVPAASQLLRTASRLGYSAVEAEPVLKEFHALLQRPLLRQLLAASSYEAMELLPFSEAVNQRIHRDDFLLDVRRELQVGAELDGAITSGTIDRLVLFKRGANVVAADIIDFKTDTVSPEDGAVWKERIEHYSHQLAAYRATVSTIFDLPADCISSRLAFVERPLIVSVTPLPSA